MKTKEHENMLYWGTCDDITKNTGVTRVIWVPDWGNWGKLVESAHQGNWGNIRVTGVIGVTHGIFFGDWGNQGI
jgi:hypothetical protein